MRAIPIALPAHVASALGGERAEVALQAGRRIPRGKGAAGIALGIGVFAFAALLFAAFAGKVLLGGESRFEVNGEPVVASPGNLEPLLLPIAVTGLFGLAGLALVAGSLVGLLSKGPWFLATRTRLLSVSRRETRSIDWEQFSGDIQVLDEGKDVASLVLGLRTGRFVSRGKGRRAYEPERIEIASIPHARDVAEYCRRRIKENDPTPPRSLDPAPDR